MNLKNKLIESINQYENDDKMKSFVIDEEMFTEDYPQSFNVADLDAQTTYAGKKRYLEQHLRKIGAGSSRIVYLVDNTKVIKLAKNEKGLAQNQVENDYYIQNEYSDVVAHIFDTDNKDYWIEMELAKRLSPKRFKELIGLDWDEYCYVLRFVFGPTKFNIPEFNQEKIDFYYEHPFAGQILDMSGNAGTSFGDLIRISSYGEVSRNGKPLVVLVDYGANEDVISTYYKKKR